MTLTCRVDGEPLKSLLVYSFLKSLLLFETIFESSCERGHHRDTTVGHTRH